MNDKIDKEDKIKNDADKSLVPVIIAIVIGWVLLAILASVIIIKISNVTPSSGPLYRPACVTRFTTADCQGSASWLD